MDAVTLALAKKHTNEQVVQKATNSPVEEISFDGGIYSVGNDVVNGQVSDVVVKGLTATNLVKNGDFNNGSSNWVLTSNTSLSITDRVATLIQTTDAKNELELKQEYGSFTNGSKIYISFFGKRNAESCTSIGCPYGDGDTHKGWATTSISPTINTWGKLSGLLSLTSDISNLRLRFRGAMDTETSLIGDSISIQKPLVVNLTTTFGAGNEPTKEECDKIFANWFDGTKSTNSVRLRSVNEDETKESIVTLPEIGRSLPNGVKDEVCLSQSTGKWEKIQRVKPYVLQLNDIKSIEDINGFQRVNIELSAITDNLAFGLNDSIGFTYYNDYSNVTSNGATWSSNSFYIINNPNRLRLIKSLGTYTSLTDAQNELAGTSLNYQLATPIVTKLPAQAPLQVFENGTVYVEPIGDASESTLPSVEMTIPTGTSNKFGVASHDYGGAAADWTLTNSESKCFLLAVSSAGGAANIIAPDAPGALYAISNASGQTVTIKIRGGTGVAVNTGKKVLVIHDGTDYVALTAEL